MNHYVFSRPKVPVGQVPEHWQLAAVLPADEEVEDYLILHSRVDKTEYHTVAANSEWEARANVQLGAFEY